MQVSRAVLVAVVWGMCMAACTPLPKSFTPHTPEEQAVVHTITTFLSAWRARDVVTLKTLVLPEATMDAFVDGSRIPPKPILALQQSSDNSPLLQATAERLVNFRQASPTTASVETYVHDSVRVQQDTNQVTTRIRWDLAQQERQWRIQHIAQTTWLVPSHVRGAGP